MSTMGHSYSENERTCNKGGHLSTTNLSNLDWKCTLDATHQHPKLSASSSPPTQFLHRLKRNNLAARTIQYAFRQCHIPHNTTRRITPQSTPAASYITTTNPNSPKKPTDFPIGCRIVVALPHSHASTTGTVTQHTPKFYCFHSK